MEHLPTSSGGPVSQKDLLIKAFIDIKKDVTREDRVNCAKEIARSRRTVNEYVNGHVHNLSIGVQLLGCLKGKIAKRTEEIK